MLMYDFNVVDSWKFYVRVIHFGLAAKIGVSYLQVGDRRDGTTFAMIDNRIAKRIGNLYGVFFDDGD